MTCFMSLSLFDSNSDMQVSGRAGAAIVVLTHLVRSFFFEDSKSSAAIREEIISFRSEILKAEQLVHRTNLALESCLSVSGFQSKIIEAGLIIIVQLSVVLFFWWALCRRSKKVEVGEPETESESETAPSPKASPSALCDLKVEVPIVGVPVGRGKPLRPSDLKAIRHG